MLHNPPQVSTMTALPACRRAPATLASRRTNLRFSSFQKSVRKIPFPFGDSVGAGFPRPASSFSPFVPFVVKNYPPYSFLLRFRGTNSFSTILPFVPQKTPKIIFLFKFIPSRLVPTHKTANPVPARGLFVPHLFFEKQIPFPA